VLENHIRGEAGLRLYLILRTVPGLSTWKNQTYRPIPRVCSGGLRKIKEKASPFTAGMNPTVLIQPTFGMLNGYFKC